MSDRVHPLSTYLREAGETVAAFAERAKISRMQLYRIINGGNTSLDTLRRLSEATGGEVAVSDFVAVQEAAE